MPAPFVTAVYGTLVALLTAWTSAPATTAPLVSVTRPLNCAFDVWACTGRLDITSANGMMIATVTPRRSAAFMHFFFMAPNASTAAGLVGNVRIPASYRNHSYSAHKTSVYVGSRYFFCFTAFHENEIAVGTCQTCFLLHTFDHSLPFSVAWFCEGQALIGRH